MVNLREHLEAQLKEFELALVDETAFKKQCEKLRGRLEHSISVLKKTLKDLDDVKHKEKIQ